MPEDAHRQQARRDRIELFAALLISFAAALTAVATYQGDDLDGRVRDANTEALAQTSYANDVYNDANALRAIERDWFFSWLIEAQNDRPAAEYLASAMPREVDALIEEFFAAEDDILNPFAPEAQEAYASYGALPSVEKIREGNAHMESARCAVLEARTGDRLGNRIDLSLVFLAITLVTAGLAALLKGRLAQLLVLGTAVACLLVGVGLLLAAADEPSVRAEVGSVVFEIPQPVFVGMDGELLDEPVELEGAELADFICG